MTDLAIPEEFSDQLTFRECLDKRTEAEILESLSNHQPVTSEKNVWAFWDKGLSAMPAWCQRNVVDWVRILGSAWTVRVLDSIPCSPNYALKYIPASSVPEAWIQGTMDGPYKGPHACDLLRGSCLYEHGGVFMDVGNVLIRHLDRICWNKLEDPSSPFQVSVPWMYGLTMANHFVAARKGDPFIKRWYLRFLERSDSTDDLIGTNCLHTCGATERTIQALCKVHSWLSRRASLSTTAEQAISTGTSKLMRPLSMSTSHK